ncbi:MAG: hypothetical protein R3208_04160 [Ketobacteraceae bacterium]|nr:hypothetical protein [Ketobacteraceae bacterium]
MKKRHLFRPFVVTFALFLGVLAHGQARGDMLVIVNADNPLEALTLKEVKQLFLGRMRRFPTLDTDVDVLDREETSQAHRSFYQYVIDMDTNRLKRYRARYLFSGQGRLPETVSGQAKIIEKVQSNISAVGYVELDGGDLPAGVKAVYRQSLPEAEARKALSEVSKGAASGSEPLTPEPLMLPAKP